MPRTESHLYQKEIEMLDIGFTPLYYLSSFAGLVMVAGGIWLLYKQKIYIDSESKQVIEVELPIGKFKTNLPVLVLFALGFVPLIYPLVLCHNMFPLLSINPTPPSRYRLDFNREESNHEQNTYQHGAWTPRT
jgi:hypothetical protein